VWIGFSWLNLGPVPDVFEHCYELSGSTIAGIFMSSSATKTQSCVRRIQGVSISKPSQASDLPTQY
jgi:hypothetical protein